MSRINHEISFRTPEGWTKPKPVALGGNTGVPKDADAVQWELLKPSYRVQVVDDSHSTLLNVALDADRLDEALQAILHVTSGKVWIPKGATPQPEEEDSQ